MTKLKIIGVAVLLMSSAIASPVMAKDNDGQQPQKQMSQKQMRMTPHKMTQRHMAYRRDDMTRRDSARMARNGDDMNHDARAVYPANGWNNSGWNDAWNNNWDRRDTGFWPGEVASDVVGGALATADAAIDTAGAIVTTPFRSNSYAYYDANNGWNGYNNAWDHESYAQRNGFVCQPGTWFKGEDGRNHICQ